MDIKNNSYLLIEWDDDNNLINITIHENRKSARYLSLIDNMSHFKIIKMVDILEYSDYQKIIFNFIGEHE